MNIPTGMEGSYLYDVRESLLILSYRYSLHTFIPSLPSFLIIILRYVEKAEKTGGEAILCLQLARDKNIIVEQKVKCP